MPEPKTTELVTICRMALYRQDMLYKDSTSNPTPTSFLVPDILWVYANRYITRKHRYLPYGKVNIYARKSQKDV